MTSRLLEIATFEALALFELLSPRLRNDRLSRMVVSGEAGQRARRLLSFAVAVTADRQARLRERRLRPEHGRSGGYHVPDFTVYSLDDLQLLWPLPDEQQ